MFIVYLVLSACLLVLAYKIYGVGISIKNNTKIPDTIEQIESVNKQLDATKVQLHHVDRVLNPIYSISKLLNFFRHY